MHVDEEQRLATDQGQIWRRKLSTLGCYLAQRGFTVQRPVKRAYKQIDLFFLPPYVSEYNLDELLNSDVKRNAGAN